MLNIFSVCDDSIQVLNMHISDGKAEYIHLNTVRRHEWYNMCRNNAYIFRAPHYILNRSFVMCKFVDDIWQKADNFPPGQLRLRFGHNLVVGLFVWLCYTCFTQDQEPGPWFKIKVSYLFILNQPPCLPIQWIFGCLQNRIFINSKFWLHYPYAVNDYVSVYLHFIVYTYIYVYSKSNSLCLNQHIKLNISI